MDFAQNTIGNESVAYETQQDHSVMMQTVDESSAYPPQHMSLDMSRDQDLAGSAMYASTAGG